MPPVKSPPFSYANRQRYKQFGSPSLAEGFTLTFSLSIFSYPLVF